MFAPFEPPTSESYPLTEFEATVLLEKIRSQIAHLVLTGEAVCAIVPRRIAMCGFFGLAQKVVACRVHMNRRRDSQACSGARATQKSFMRCDRATR